MRKNLKRTLAVFCALAMFAGGVLTGNGQVVKADGTGTETNEWSVMKDVDLETGGTYVTTGFGLNMTKTAAGKANYRLYVRMNIPESVYNAATANGTTTGTLHMELCETTCDVKEYDFRVTDFKPGENEWTLPWTMATDNTGASLSATMNYCRIYFNTANVSLGGAVVYEMKAVYIPNREWTIFKNVTIPSTGQYITTGLGLNINKTSDYEKNLILYIKMNVPESVYNAINTRLVIELCRAACDKYEYEFRISKSDLKAGENVFALPWTTAVKSSGANGVPSLDTEMNYCRIFADAGGTNLNGILLSEMKAVDTTPYIKEYKPVGDTTTGAEAGTSPEKQGFEVYDVPDGYLFAGWYTDSACESENALKGTANDTAYAKFVRSDLLNVKGQYARTADDSTAIRFVTTVDSLQYQQVGFTITINGKTLEKNSTVVYDTLYAVGSNSERIAYKPTEIGATSKYFNTYTIEGIPDTAYDTPITVQAFWVTQDGTKVSGTERTFKLSDVINN